MKTLNQWNEYLEDLNTLRDRICENYEKNYGSARDENVCSMMKLSKKDCDILTTLLSSAANKVVNTPLVFIRKDEE